MVQTVNDVQELNLTDLRHPSFTGLVDDWQLWRDVYEGGTNFVDRYLEEFSRREDSLDYLQRKKMTPPAEFAASAVDDVKNNIYQRMIDISRQGGSSSYQSCITGADDGVDLVGSSMNYYIGQKVLPELLVMKRVGVYVDMPPINGVTLMDVRVNNVRPYIYLYRAEEICNWTLDLSVGPNEYGQVLLKEVFNAYHPQFKFPYRVDTRYRHMFLNEEGLCTVHYYDLSGDRIDEFGDKFAAEYVLPIRRIPFVCFELPSSLLKAAARYQIALMNIGSSDINYILRANFPFYTEQQDLRATSPHTQQAGTDGQLVGESVNGGGKEVRVGTATGRSYAMGMDRPGFIHPSPEPLKASMEKQEQLKRDIRLLINLAITNMAPTKQQSAESKGLDNAGLEAGLSFIGLELERGERRIADFWAMYENSAPATVNYPIRYSLKSDEERRAEVKEYKEVLPIIPSLTYQRQVCKQIARAVVGYKVSREDMEKIEKEIERAPFVNVAPDVIHKSVELGVLDRENAAQGLAYPENAVDRANKEHAERLVRIAESQTPAAGARGVNDLSGDPKNDATNEKTVSRNNDQSGDGASKVRGAGNGSGQTS